ncbi:LAME_0D02278g1_1 [Lachancea meyersii CBS 8951]|uniref:Protein BIG1 n=1 Tax=Lachancea meyersii CBS 8951 TaxID=1266667 RepID=A0A1G4J741_9SACH|nr:LAME_0D02278g1_1 [Lachancea meyersii CBS 8951]
MKLFALKSIVSLIALARFSFQESVPAVLGSHKLAAGLLEYQVQYDNSNVLSQDSFVNVAEKMISRHRSDAYLFVNIPGLTVSDFAQYHTQLESLEKVLKLSSTALRFEDVEVERTWEDVFDKLISFAEEEWDITDRIEVRDNHMESFQRYIDWRPRTIRIDFDEIPSENKGEYFGYCDQVLRHVLGQLPTADNTIILTSLVSQNNTAVAPAGSHEATGLTRIFPDVFEDPQKKADIEKNAQKVQKRHVLNAPKPRFTGMEDTYLSVFDTDFLDQNCTIIELIVLSPLAYAILQLATRGLAWRSSQTRRKVPEQKKNQ